MTSRRAFLQHGLAGLAGVSLGARSGLAATRTRYVCPPCGCAMDGAVFDAPGRCPACGMTLIVRADDLRFEPQTIAKGSGAFLVAGGLGKERKRIRVCYHMPERFGRESQVILVIPGTGRNANDYRDAWVEAAERFNVLVAALSYPEADYDFAAYHLGGVVTDLEIDDLSIPADGVVRLRDEDIRFRVNPRPTEWLFRDFDRIFAILRSATGSIQTGYDMFGHSAGGQILHRLVLFHPHSRARRVVAANAGLYTLPRLDIPPLIGLQGTGVTRQSLAASFGSHLTLLLGELDDSDAAGGIQLHTPLFDQQGIGRLTRGRHFFQTGVDQARAMDVPFNWTLRVVPGVGHDYRRMSEAAAAFLYA